MIGGNLCKQLVNFIFKQLFILFRFELRIRYIPASLNEILVNDKVTFYYFYDQVSLRIKWLHWFYLYF